MLCNGPGFLTSGGKINPKSPINRNLVSMWLAASPFDGGKYLYDLCNVCHLIHEATSPTWIPSIGPFQSVRSAATSEGAWGTAPSQLKITSELTIQWYGRIIGDGAGYGVLFQVSYTDADTPPYAGFGFDRDGPGNIIRFIANNGSSLAASATLLTQPSGLFHIVGVITTGGQGLAYVNGQLITSAFTPGATRIYANAQVHLGMNHFLPGRYANCLSQFAAIHNRALSLAEIQEYNQQVRMALPDVLSYVPVTSYFIQPIPFRTQFRVDDRVCETTETSGTGSLLLAGAVSKCRTFADVTLTYYCAVHRAAYEWEMGVARIDGLTTLVRLGVVASSNSNDYVDFSAGTKDVFIPCNAPMPNSFSAPVFGSGSDGNVTISSGTTTLTRDMYYKNLTISGTGKIDTAGFRLFVSEVLDLSAAPADAISRNGLVGTGATSSSGAAAATGLASAQLGGSPNSTAGSGAGGTVAGLPGNAGTASSPSNGGSGGASGAGGAGSSTAGGAVAAGGVASNSVQFSRKEFRFYRMTSMTAMSLIFGGASGASGGGAGGNGSSPGGGGGSGGVGGGVVAVYARCINRGAGTAAGVISAVGGVGGGGANAVTSNTGGGGAGGGGGGGFIYMIFQSLIGAPKSGAVRVNGGAGGVGGNAQGVQGGDGGNGGAGGMVVMVCTGTNAVTVAGPGTGGATGGLNVGATGGTGGAGEVVGATL